MEVQLLSDVAAVVDNGDDTAGITAGYFSWVKTNTIFGATGADGGFNTTTKVTDAPTAGTKINLTEEGIRDVAQSVYETGGDTEYICGTPQVIRNLSEYLFTSSARVATQTNQKQGENKDKSSTAYGAVTVFVTDFGQILKLVSNRLHPQAGGGVPVATVSHLAFIDPRGIRVSFMQGIPDQTIGANRPFREKIDLCRPWSRCDQ